MMRLRWLSLSLAIGLNGCQDYPFQVQLPQRVGARSYHASVSTSEKTDILFVIDNSGSMEEEQEKLKQNVAAFIDVLSRSANDYQVGIISTDVHRKPSDTCSPCCDLDTDGDTYPDWSNCDDGRLYAEDFRTRVLRRPAAIEGETAEEHAARVQVLVDAFNDTVTTLGTGGSAFEAGFEAMRRALDPEGDPIVRVLNRGFLRPDANLAVIFLTDEDECSADDAWLADTTRDDAACYYDATLRPVSEYVDFLVGLKGSLDAVRAAAITGGVVDANATNRLGFSAAGCYTDEDTASPQFGEASNACGCWSSRHLVDPRIDETGDFYCNYLADSPFLQPSTRVPLLDHNQGGCIALPGSRLVAFLEDLASRREAAGLPIGVLADSLCRADYGGTLEQIASSIVLSNCFLLEELPLSEADMVVHLNGVELPRVAVDSGTPGWSYDASRNAVCLEGGLTKSVGDIFSIDVLTDVQGFDGGD